MMEHSSAIKSGAFESFVEKQIRFETVMLSKTNQRRLVFTIISFLYYEKPRR